MSRKRDQLFQRIGVMIGSPGDAAEERTRERAGHNASERRAGPETISLGADLALIRGRHLAHIGSED